MPLAKSVFLFPIILSSILMVFLIALSWIQRVERLAQALIWVAMSMLVCSTAYTLEILSSTLDQKILWENIRITGSFSISYFWLVFVCVYTGREGLLKRYQKIFIAITVLFIIGMWTDQIHHLFRSQWAIERPAYGFPILNISYTSLFYSLFSPYTTLIFLSCLGLLLDVFRKAQGRYRIQAALILASMLPPSVAELLVVLGKTPLSSLSFTPHAFLLTGILIGWAVFKFDLYRSVLLARDVVVDTLQEGVIVVDRHGQIIDLNESARMMLGISAENVIGMPVVQVLSITGVDAEVFLAKEKQCVEINLGQLYLEMNIVPVIDNAKLLSARIITMYDVTERVLLMEQLRHLAQYDTLTGVMNRSALFEKAQTVVNQSRFNSGCFSLIMLDIDHFKRINDQYGHQTGDRALKLVVDICSSMLRAGDLMGRYGGEEFIVILPETGLREAQKIAERLRAAIEHTPLVTERGFDRITSSFGVCCSTMFGYVVDLDKMISIADQALYQAKGKGANQVVIMDSLPTIDGLTAMDSLTVIDGLKATDGLKAINHLSKEIKESNEILSA